MVLPITNLTRQPKKRTLTIFLALIGTVTPLVGLHKFYLGQPLWGIIYLIIGWQNPMARIACCIDIILYLTKNQEQFNLRFNSHLTTSSHQTSIQTQQVIEIATALRELETLRQEGLISEYEFEQKRRQLLA